MKPRHYITYNDRIRIELLYNKEKNTARQIAHKLNFSVRTIYYELRRGWCDNLDTELRTIRVYSAELAQSDYAKHAEVRGPRLKIGKDHKLAAYIEDKIINDKYSPDAVLYDIKHKKMRFSVTISRTTLYKYIDDNVFLELSNKHLPQGKRAKKKKHQPRRISYKDPMKESIENRPAHINNRIEFGHWEMDTVYSDKKDGSACLLVLTGRKTRYQIAHKMKARTSAEVVKALDLIERGCQRNYKYAFKDIFKTITCDNGSEFADIEGMEQSCYAKRGKRTKLYFCHPFCSGERGSNENANRGIRRFIPKGAKISDYTKADVARVTRWMNNYPRGIFDGLTSSNMITNEIEKR